MLVHNHSHIIRTQQQIDIYKQIQIHATERYTTLFKSLHTIRRREHAALAVAAAAAMNDEKSSRERVDFGVVVVLF